MNKILRLFFCVSLLAAPCLGAGTATVVAETEIPEETVVSTIPTMATEPAASQPEDSATIPEKEPEPSKDKLEDVPEPEATKESEEEEEKPGKQPTTKGASPYAVTLIEGVDIDAAFAQMLRTKPNVTNLNTSWSGYGKGQDQLTDMDMEAVTNIAVRGASLTSLKGIEYAINLVDLTCSQNSLTTLDLSNNPLLVRLDCSQNSLTTLDLSNNPLLTHVSCRINQLTDLDVSDTPVLTTLDCAGNKLTSLDVSNSPMLTVLELTSNALTALNVSNNPMLTDLDCYNNKLTSLDVSNNPNLISLNCGHNTLSSLDLSATPLLETLICHSNYEGSLAHPTLSHLDLRKNVLLKRLDCYSNGFADNTLDLTGNPLLERLICDQNNFTTLDLSNNSSLIELSISGNQLTNLNFISASANPLLVSLSCSNNKITDITGAFGLTNLIQFTANNQMIQSGIPPIAGGNATVDVLKTSASTGLSLSNISIGGSPILTPNGDKIELSNVTYADLNNKQLQ
ncbi:hypothetical protein JZO85_20870, partial [Enterococcus sp. MJM16]|nr:hypothetical protein [Enterococcus sp. MJM16]